MVRPKKSHLPEIVKFKKCCVGILYYKSGLPVKAKRFMIIYRSILQAMETIELAKILKENELLIGEVYQECQRLFPDHADDFKELAREEKGHAELFAEIIAAIILQPDNWHSGRLSLQTARVVNERLKENLAEIRQNKVAPRYAITFALSFELSMSEKEFCKMLVTSDADWQKRLKIINEGFPRHYKKLLSLEKNIFSDSQKMDFTSL